MATKTVTIGSINDWNGGVIYNYPEPRYTAELYMRGYWNPVTEEIPTAKIDLAMGENNIDFDGYNSKATLTVKALQGFKLTTFQNTYYSDAVYTLTETELIYELTQDEINMGWIGLREYVIKADKVTADPDPTQKPFIVGNVRDSNGVRYVGEVMYSATVTVTGAYDPITETYPKQDYSLQLGIESIVKIKSTDTAILKLDALQGFEFVSFENVAFPSNAYSLTPNSIVYNLSNAEIIGLSENMFKYVATATETGGVVTPDTITNNYLLTKERFKTFQSELFNKLAVENIEGQNVLVNDYLSSAKIYPFNINPVDIWGEEPVKIRDYNFVTLGKVLNNDYLTIDFGEIETPKTNDNATDIVGVTCELILPFRQGVISLDPYKVIGKKIFIEGRLFISKGEITISIYDSNGVNFNISNFTIGADQLIAGTTRIEQNMFSPSQALTGVNKAYLLIKTPIYDETPQVLKEGILNTEKGRIEVTEVNLKGNILGNEKTLIENLLKNGVYIND